MTTNAQLSDPNLQRQRKEHTDFRSVAAMALPVVITTSSRAMMDVADYYMITKLGIAQAQAAILPAQMIMWTYIIFGLGIVSVVSTFASQSLGKGQPRDASGYAWQVIYIAALAGLIVLPLRPWLPNIFALMGHEPKVQQQELAYMRAAIFNIAPSIGAYGLGWFFVGVHRPLTTMWSALEANVVNIAVSAVLIFGLLGFEPMGIAGAAWGTVIAVTFRTVRLAFTMAGPSIAKEFDSRNTWRPSFSKIKDLLRVGLPCGLQFISEVLVWTIFVTVLIGSRFGTVHLIATNTAWQYMRLAFMPANGVGQALTALVGKSIGAGVPVRAIKETKFAALITIAYMCGLSVIYLSMGDRLIGLFNSDPQVIRIGYRIMICVAAFQLFDAIGITYHAALKGAGDTLVPSIVFIISTWLIVIGGGWCASRFFPQLESLGPWIAAATFIFVTSAFLWWRWRKQGWMHINVFKDKSAPPQPLDTVNQATVLTD